MLIIGLGGTYMIEGNFNMSLGQLKHMTYGTFASYSFSIIPLFLLMGQFAAIGGLSKSLFKTAESWLGHKKGGVAMSAIGGCAGFGAICGSSLATAATMGQVALPELRKYGYSGALSTATLAAGGTLGILIPPSIILVIYAIIAEQNIAKLFAAGFLPGLMAALFYMLTIRLYIHYAPNSGGIKERLPYKKRFKQLATTWPIITIFALVVGGIYGGFFSPTEAAAIGAAGTGMIALTNGCLNLSSLKEAILKTAQSTGMIFFILLGAAIFNSFIGLTQMPQEAAKFIIDAQISPWLILIAILFLYLLLGCVMDSLSMIILTVPIFFPVLSGLDFGLTPDEFAIWFGILVLTVVEVGLITPPVGMNLFVINNMAKDIAIIETFKGVMPFILSDLIRVIMLLLFPSISLCLVWLLY